MPTIKFRSSPAINFLENAEIVDDNESRRFSIFLYGSKKELYTFLDPERIGDRPQILDQLEGESEGLKVCKAIYTRLFTSSEFEDFGTESFISPKSDRNFIKLIPSKRSWFIDRHSYRSNSSERPNFYRCDIEETCKSCRDHIDMFPEIHSKVYKEGYSSLYINGRTDAFNIKNENIYLSLGLTGVDLVTSSTGVRIGGRDLAPDYYLRSATFFPRHFIITKEQPLQVDFAVNDILSNLAGVDYVSCGTDVFWGYGSLPEGFSYLDRNSQRYFANFEEDHLCEVKNGRGVPNKYLKSKLAKSEKSFSLPIVHRISFFGCIPDNEVVTKISSLGWEVETETSNFMLEKNVTLIDPSKFFLKKNMIYNLSSERWKEWPLSDYATYYTYFSEVVPYDQVVDGESFGWSAPGYIDTAVYFKPDFLFDDQDKNVSEDKYFDRTGLRICKFEKLYADRYFKTKLQDSPRRPKKLSFPKQWDVGDQNAFN